MRAGRRTGARGARHASTVTRHGITWRFAERVRVGRFVNGDYYVVGPVTVTEVDPPAVDGRNGSILNLPSTTASVRSTAACPGTRPGL